MYMKVWQQSNPLNQYTGQRSLFPDFFLSTELILDSKLEKWINRQGFGTRKLLILKWIVLGSILSMSYKSTLLSTLVTIRYEKTIETVFDLDTSRLPLLLTEGTTTAKLMELDQRAVIKRIYSRRIMHPWGKLEEPLKKCIHLIRYIFHFGSLKCFQFYTGCREERPLATTRNMGR